MTKEVKVTTYKVHIPRGYAPHGRWVVFTDKKAAERYHGRCGSAKIVTVQPNTHR